jgi:hypothetical protein
MDFNFNDFLADTSPLTLLLVIVVVALILA